MQSDAQADQDLPRDLTILVMFAVFSFVQSNEENNCKALCHKIMPVLIRITMELGCDSKKDLGSLIKIVT